MGRRIVLLIFALVLLSGPTTSRADPGNAVAQDPLGDGNPDLTGAVGTWNENGWLVFAVPTSRSALFAGEDLGVVIDTDGREPVEYRFNFHQYADGYGARLERRTADGNWDFDTPNATTGSSFSDGAAFLSVREDELGYPTGSIAFYAYSTGGPYAGLIDYTDWLTLPAPSQVGGTSGPGVAPPGGGTQVPRGARLRVGKPLVRGRRLALRTRILRGHGRVRVTLRRGRSTVRARATRRGNLYLHRARLPRAGRWRIVVTFLPAKGWKRTSRTLFVRARG